MKRILFLFLALCTCGFAQIKAVVFDYGGVIVDFDNGPAAAVYAQDHSQEGWEERFHQAIIEGTTIRPGMLELVRQLQDSGYFVALFSNVTKGAASHIRKMGLYEPFDAVFLSCDLGAIKPSCEAYALFLEGMPCTADEIFFIDDQEENVIGAQECGIHAHHFSSLEKLLEDLSLFDILIGEASGLIPMQQ